MTGIVYTIVLFSFFNTSNAYAGNMEGAVTPYGVHCDVCGDYGYCEKAVTQEQAAGALQSYYQRRGFHVIVLRQNGRFLEAAVYKNGGIVDRILFDVRTGRLRSMY